MLPSRSIKNVCFRNKYLPYETREAILTETSMKCPYQVIYLFIST